MCWLCEKDHEGPCEIVLSGENYTRNTAIVVEEDEDPWIVDDTSWEN